MKISKTRLKEIIKEEVSTYRDDTEKYDAPEYRVNDIITSAAMKAVKNAVYKLVENKPQGDLFQGPGPFIHEVELDLEEPLMDILLPIAIKITGIE